MQIKLQEALLRRKELAEKLNVIRHIKDNTLIYQVRNQRVKVTEGIDNLDLDVPKLELSQVTAEYDYVAKQLRLIDSHIQQTNWTAEITIDPMLMEPYQAPGKPVTPAV